MSITNILPPSDKGGLGLESQQWSSGIFNKGSFDGSLSVYSSNNANHSIFSESSSVLNYSNSTDGTLNAVAIKSDLPADINQISNGSNYVGSDNLTKIVRISQVDYDNLGLQLDESTLYIIIN